MTIKFLTADEVAKLIGVSLPAVYRGVADGRLPLPRYPAARSPRWIEGEVLAALEATRLLPRDAKARVRASKLERIAAQRAVAKAAAAEVSTAKK